MKRRTIVLAAAVMLAPAMAGAQGGLPTCGSAPTGSTFLWAFANNACRDFTSFIVTNPDGQSWTMNTPRLEVGRSLVQLTGTWDSDASIGFGATTVNLMAGPVTYTVLFGVAPVPGFYRRATGTGSVSVTNGVGGTTTVATSGVYPAFLSGYGTVGPVPTNLGVDSGNVPCVASGVPFTVTTTCSQGTTYNSFGPTFYDNLEYLVTYTQDDAGSVASWSGTLTITSTTPEPATIALFATGLVVIGGFGVRRRKS